MDLGGRRPPLASRIGALAGALLLLAAACTTPPNDTPGDAEPTLEAPASVRIAAAEPESLDPAALATPGALLLADQIFDGLVSYDPVSLAVVPAAAARWKVRDGGRRFVFELRRKARFHDGDPVRAADFKRAWDRLTDPLAQHPFAFLLERVDGFRRSAPALRAGSGLAGVRALGRRTLEVRLSEPWPDFVALLGHPSLAPVPAGADRPRFARQPVGNGPYRLASPLVPGSNRIELERFSGYWGPAPRVSTLEIRTYPEPAEGWPEFVAGEMDIATVPGSVLAEAKSRYGGQGIVTLARLLHCGFNRDDRRLRHRALRVAVSQAVDRTEVAAQVYGGLATAAAAIVPPTIPGSQDGPCGPRCTLDRARAASLVSELPRRSRSFRLDYNRSRIGDRLAEVVVAHLGEVGLEVRPRAHQAREFAALLRDGKHEMFCLVGVGDHPRPQALLEPLLAGPDAESPSGVRDRRLSSLLDRARAERNRATREQLYRRAEIRALEVLAIIPLAWFRSHLAAQPYVGGFRVTPLDRFDAARLTLKP